MNPTSYPEVNALLADMLTRLRDVLDEQLIGLYLHGSLVAGDFDLALSDVDMLAVLADDLDDATAARLEAMHRALAADYPAWDDRIETAYLSRAALATFKTQDTRSANISPGEPFHLLPMGRLWLMNWYMVRERGMTLYGPPPETVIPPISQAEFIAAVREHLQWWSEWGRETDARRAAQAYVVLTMCRALYALAHGSQTSKVRAAAWAAEAFPEWAGLIQRAVAWRTADDDSPSDAAELTEVRRFVESTVELARQ
jgi:hypothetical protein